MSGKITECVVCSRNHGQSVVHNFQGDSCKLQYWSGALGMLFQASVQVFRIRCSEWQQNSSKVAYSKPMSFSFRLKAS